MVLEYAKYGNFNNWINRNYKNFSWNVKSFVLYNIFSGLQNIHQNGMIHRDFHTGNILLTRYTQNYPLPYISDMGLCGEVGSIDETKIYGVMPYVAPEVLKGKPYTQAADIYSFGMIMYFVATGKQPFSDRAHDQYLVLSIYNGIRPNINEPEAPKCYIDLMKKCWDSNPDKRPKATEICELIDLFHSSYIYDELDFKHYIKIEKKQQHYEIEKQLKEAEEYRKIFNLYNDDNDNDNDNYDDDDDSNDDNSDDIGDDDDNDDQTQVISFLDRSRQNPQAIYSSRLLNPYIKDLGTECSECLDCEIKD